MYREAKTQRCATCNGACCKVFSLDYSKSDLWEWIFHPKKCFHKEVPRFEFIKQFLLLKNINDTPFVKHLKATKHGYKHLYSCRMLSKKGKCRIYKHRFLFCYGYDCHGCTQLAHVEFNGQPFLPKLNKNKDYESTEKRKEAIRAEVYRELEPLDDPSNDQVKSENVAAGEIYGK